MTGKEKVAWIGLASAVAVALIGALATVGGRLVTDDPPQETSVTLRAKVRDLKCGKNPAAEVSLTRLDGGALGAPQQTDVNGEVTLHAPKDAGEVFIVATSPGYASFKQKVPAASGTRDLNLEPLPIRRGIPDNTQLDSFMTAVQSDLNVRIDFAPSCTARARRALLSDGALAGNSCAPIPYIEQTLARVKGRPALYTVTEITPSQRYEISCH